MRANKKDSIATWSVVGIIDNIKVTISIARQAVAGEDFTYPSITTPSTGLYQYIDNHIKNFDLSWQILD